jgi:hypothetical protein
LSAEEISLAGVIGITERISESGGVAISRWNWPVKELASRITNGSRAVGTPACSEQVLVEALPALVIQQYVPIPAGCV